MEVLDSYDSQLTVTHPPMKYWKPMFLLVNDCANVANVGSVIMLMLNAFGILSGNSKNCQF